MHSLGDLLPEPEVLLRLEPEEIGGLLLQYLTAALDPAGNFYRGRFEMDLYGSDSSYSHAKRSEVTEALHEAVAWLEGQALIIWPNGYSGGTEYRKLSRKGRSLGSPAAWDAYRWGKALPRQLLHPRIEARTYFAFIRGEYDTAIFQAFKEVEIAVRDNATGVDEKHYGVTLIRAAFHPKTGPLRDEYATEAEREALMNLMAGALGLYKNPHSHKEVRVSPREAIEMILIANHLLNIVEWRVVMS